MGRKSVLKPYAVVTNGDMSSDVTSSVTDVTPIESVSYQIVYTGTPTGTFTVEGSHDEVTWEALVLSADILAAGSADNHLINLTDLGFPKIRLKYTASSGTGTLNATIAGNFS